MNLPNSSTRVEHRSGMALLACEPCIRITMRARFWFLWQNFCRLILIRPGVQWLLVLGAVAWWWSRRDPASTVAAVSLVFVIGTWQMSRERIRRCLAGDLSRWGLSGRAEDDWCTFHRPLRCLDEINVRRADQERRDRIAFRLGIACTLLAVLIGAAGAMG